MAGVDSARSYRTAFPVGSRPPLDGRRATETIVMTRLYFEPITVECTEGRPQVFTWRRQAHRITAILKRWIVRVDWWRQEISRSTTKSSARTSEHTRSIESGWWFLERLYD